MSHIIHNDDNSGWRLVVTESTMTGKSELEMCKTIPYDGVLKRSTVERQYVSHRKNSTFNLSASEVLDRYEDKTGAEIRRCKMCKEWPAGAQEDGAYRRGRFCSVACEVKYDHLKDDARDAARADMEAYR